MKNKTVLYVEDDENDVFFLRRAFTKAGIMNPLIVMTDGEAAISYLAGEGRYADRESYPRPCLILLDVNLPKKNGLEVLRWVRQKSEIFTTPVVILSASNRPGDIHTACALGANAYMVKPPSEEQLIELARSIRDFWLTHSQTPPDCLTFQKKTLQDGGRRVP